jgi:DNA-binding NarL/FixJ family response regulator
LARQHERPADLLITDIFMPILEGFETISRFKAEFPQTRIIAMSAGSSSGMKHDYLSTAGLVGVDATLYKPFGPDKLIETVRTVLGSRSPK